MASHAKAWPAFTSMSLRNELRSTDNSTADTAPYDWENWYANMVPAADAINAANPDPLIFYSGLDYDTQLSTIVNGNDIGNGTSFSLDDYSYKDKIVWELHNYANSAAECDSISSSLYDQGYNAMDPAANVTNRAPVVLTEFGFDQRTDSTSVYAACIRSYLTSLPGGPGGWMQWVISGSYYIRSGSQDYDETWGECPRLSL